MNDGASLGSGLRVPILKVNGNFNFWLFQMRAYFLDREVLEVVNGQWAELISLARTHRKSTRRMGDYDSEKEECLAQESQNRNPQEK